MSKEQIKVYLYRNGCQIYPENEKGQKNLEKEEKTEVNQAAEMSKNICRLDGKQIFLSVLRDDEEAVGLYAKWMSYEATCVFIEHAHSVVDITRMPGWVSDHCVVLSHTKGETNEKKTVGALQTPTVFCHAKVKIKQLQSLMHLADHSISKLRSFGRINVIRKLCINGGGSRAIVQAKGICLNVIRCLVVSILCNTV